MTHASPETADAFDNLRRRQLPRILQDQAVHQGRLQWDRAQIEAHQRAELHSLLGHAIRRSPFHAQRLNGIDVKAVEPTDLSALPVMTKMQMMSALDDVFTDRRLTRTLTEDALAATMSEPVPVLDRYIAYASGGSSGLRGVFVYDEDGMRQFVGSFTRNLVARLRTLGTKPAGGLPIAAVAAGNATHMTGSAQAFTADGRLGFRYVSVPATLPLAEIVARLNAGGFAALAGYPSVLASLASEQQAGRLRIAPAFVAASSEPLSTDVRELLRSTFEAPVINMFGSTEGLMGTSALDDEAIVFAEDGCIVELVDDRGCHVAPGVPSTRVLITNLTNRLQPLIRYEVTDSFVRLPDSPEHGYLRATVDGRADDAFDYGAVRIHPATIRSALVHTPWVAEYQITQTARGLHAAVVGNDHTDLHAVRRRLCAALAAAGLPTPEITTDLVPRLEPSGQVGKVRRFVPLSRDPRMV